VLSNNGKQRTSCPLFCFISTKNALDQAFTVEKTHILPRKLEPPPSQWHRLYDELARECSLYLSLGDAFAEVVKIRHLILE